MLFKFIHLLILQFHLLFIRVGFKGIIHVRVKQSKIAGRAHSTQLTAVLLPLLIGSQISALTFFEPKSVFQEAKREKEKQ